MVLDDGIAFDLGIDSRDFPERMDDGLGEKKRHEAKFRPFFFKKSSWYFARRAMTGGHVDLV